MIHGVATNRSKVRGNTTPPKNATYVGQYNGQPVYQETVGVYEKRQKKDEAGAVLYHLNKDGSKRAPMVERVRVGEEQREYVIMDVHNGITRKNYHFRASEQEVEYRKAVEATKPEALAKDIAILKAAFAKLGLSPEDIAKLAEDADEAEPEPAAKKGRR